MVATDASGHRNVLMGDPDPTDPKVDAIRKSLFDDKQTIAQTAASLGLTEDELIKALPPGTVDDTAASADPNGIRTRTIYDAQTNRTFVEIDDPRQISTVVQEIQADQVFHVRQYDTKTHQYVLQDVKGGAGYAQSLATRSRPPPTTTASRSAIWTTRSACTTTRATTRPNCWRSAPRWSRSRRPPRARPTSRRARRAR